MKSNNVFLNFSIAAILISVVAIYFIFNPAEYTIFPFCPFYKITGWYCPGCGGQRAFHALLHGYFSDALCDNFLIFIILPIAALKMFQEFTGKRTMLYKLQNSYFAYGFLCFLVIFTILRNLPFHPFNLLVPQV
jgi:Protein of unknown function (DUF2752)